MQKICTKCGEEKPATTEYFYAANTGKDGLRGDCKECGRQHSKSHYAKNPEAYIRRAAEWAKANSEKLTSYKREWQAAHPEDVKRYSKKWYEANTAKARASRRAYHAKNPEIAKVEKSRRRARILFVGDSFTAADVRLALRSQRGKCWHCSKPIGDDYHVDHLIPLVKGGTNYPNNIVISCADCNHSKGGKLCQEWNGRLF